MGIMFQSMFGGEVYMPTRIYWCELNQQIVERAPEFVRLNSYGVGGYTYKNIRRSMTYLGDLD